MPTRKLLFILLFLLPLLSATAQQEADTVYVFRFVSHKDMFYIPWQGNGTQLDKLLSLVETQQDGNDTKQSNHQRVGKILGGQQRCRYYCINRKTS